LRYLHNTARDIIYVTM